MLSVTSLNELSLGYLLLKYPLLSIFYGMEKYLCRLTSVKVVKSQIQKVAAGIIYILFVFFAVNYDDMKARQEALNAEKKKKSSKLNESFHDERERKSKVAGRSALRQALGVKPSAKSSSQSKEGGGNHDTECAQMSKSVKVKCPSTVGNGGESSGSNSGSIMINSDIDDDGDDSDTPLIPTKVSSLGPRVY